MSATVTYKGETLTTATNQTRVLETEGTYLEDDITITDVTGAAPSGTKNISITANGTTTEDVTSYATASITTAVPASAVDSGTKSISTNGTHDVIGYASANVAVPNSYSASDEGKVVDNGALVSQTSATYTSNDTYDTTLIDEVTVNVSGGGGIDINAIAMGTEPSGNLVLDTATNIKERKFKECNNLTSVTAPYVTTLREQIFSSCSNLETISFANATSISSSQQFISCAKLKNVNLPKITSCGGNMFQGCSKLEFIDLPAVTTLNAARCFYGCNKLQTVILRYTGGVCPLNSEAFTNTPFAGYNGLTGTLYVPSALVASYKTASNWATLYNNGTMSVVAIEGSQYE